MKTNSYEAIWDRTKWFREARFGAFIHFGIYAIAGRGEWVQSAEKISKEKYRQYFDEFNPDSYDADEWAKVIKEAGMKYAVLTAKHHDGFCLFDSQLTDFKSTNTSCKRDLIKEYIEALRRADLKVGIYYSLLDWDHPDYPAYGDRQHPMRYNEDFKNKSHDFDKYIAYFHGQVKELCTNYGKIDIMWFDFSYWEMKGEAWKATELVKMIRELQPDIIIDNRLGGNMELSHPEIYAGDFDGPEQCIPRDMVVNEQGQSLPWEVCMTLNNSWGYCGMDKAYKLPSFVIKCLVDCVSKNGNLLVNIGPDARGRIPKQSKTILSEVGDWLRDNGESIYGCGASEIENPQWGRFTQKENTLYAHLFNPVLGHINMKGMRDKIQKARVVADGSEVIVTDFWNLDNGVSKMDSPEDVYLAFGYPVANTYDLPDPRGTVIKLELKVNR